MFGCQHEWEILSEKTTESPLEHSSQYGMRGSKLDMCAVQQLTARKLIQIVTCPKCGKLQRFVTDI